MYTFQVGSVIKCENQLKRRAHNCTIASNGEEKKPDYVRNGIILCEKERERETKGQKECGERSRLCAKSIRQASTLKQLTC